MAAEKPEPNVKHEREPAYVAETLAWCNRQRKKQGKGPLKKLPKGRRGDPTSCPCGAATGLYVFVDEAEHYDAGSGDRIYVPINRFVKDFVLNFDSGLLPQYVKKT